MNSVGRSVDRLGEDLQQPTVGLLVDQDAEALQIVPRQVEVAEAVAHVVVVGRRRLQEPQPPLPQRRHGGHDVVGAQGDVLHARAPVGLQVLLDLALAPPVGGLVERAGRSRSPSHTTVDIRAEYSVEIWESSKWRSRSKPSTDR